MLTLKSKGSGVYFVEIWIVTDILIYRSIWMHESFTLHINCINKVWDSENG